MGWLFKLANVREYVNRCSEFNVGQWLVICLRFISPIMLAGILFKNLINTIQNGYGDYPIADQLFLGWGLIAMMLFCAIFIGLVSNPNQPEERNL